MSVCPSRFFRLPACCSRGDETLSERCLTANQAANSENRSTHHKYKPLFSLAYFSGWTNPRRACDLATISVSPMKLDEADRERTARHSEGAALVNIVSKA
jgi:hypothetical protein